METWLLLAMGAAALALLLVLAAIRRRPAAKKRRIPALILEKEQDGDTFLFLLETADGTLHQPGRADSLGKRMYGVCQEPLKAGRKASSGEK